MQSSTNSIPLNQWTHVVGVGEAGQALKIYINGVEDSNTQSGTMPTLYQDANLFIGKDNGAAGRNFKGKLDELAIWDTALNAGQIYNNIYQPTKIGTNQTANLVNNPNLPNPLAWYRMGD